MQPELEKILESFPAPTQEDRNLVQHAFSLYEELYEPPVIILGQKKKEEWLERIELVEGMKLDVASLCSMILYPLLIQKKMSVQQIRKNFGKEISFLVETLQKLAEFEFSYIEYQNVKRQFQHLHTQAEKFRKMLISTAKDIRVILLRLCDSLFQLRNLELFPVGNQRQVAIECRQIYSPLANRLGIHWLKNELEDLTLRYLFPHDYYDIVDKISGTRRKREQFIEETQSILKSAFEHESISCDVYGRSKHINSIYNKMKWKGVPFEKLFDIVAFRIICKTKSDCYRALGLLHSKWKPIPGRFKDYIALPKSNLYQSLHTTVLGPQNKRMEIQIRTEEMNALAEDGIAAHWAYKEKATGNSTESSSLDTFHWLRSLLQLSEEKEDEDFLDNIHEHLEEGEIFIFSPAGEVKELPKGSTPVDFAYSIHTRVGETCIGARINEKIVPLKYKLKNGDLIEILTNPQAKPSRDWLKFVKTNRAKSKIRSYFLGQKRGETIEIGKELLEKALPASNKSISKLIKSGFIESNLPKFNLATLEEFFLAIGNQKFSPQKVADTLFPKEKKEHIPLHSFDDLPSLDVKTSTGGILVDGLDNIMINLAKCCHPIPGDAIVGFVSKGRGVVVHRNDCSKVKETSPERQINVSWDGGRNKKHTVSLRVLAENRSNLLNLISKIFLDMKIELLGASCRNHKEESINLFQCSVSDIEQLSLLISRIEEVRGVHRIERMRS